MLSQSEAKEFDSWLMTPEGGGFTLPQLMELAGLSVASAVKKFYPDRNRILIAVGPGNNGGDGLVAARHLNSFGFNVTIFRPPFESTCHYFKLLIRQAINFNVQVIDNLDRIDMTQYDLVIDAIFGFGFRGELQDPFERCVDLIIKSKIPVVSVDCPSGWTADLSTDLHPEMLISLTAPKECAKHFSGKIHILAGRFIPINLPDKYSKIKEMTLSLYESKEDFVLL